MANEIQFYVYAYETSGIYLFGVLTGTSIPLISITILILSNLCSEKNISKNILMTWIYNKKQQFSSTWFDSESRLAKVKMKKKKKTKQDLGVDRNV